MLRPFSCARRVLFSAKPVGLFDAQKALKRLPVPPLKDTCARYLRSLEPVLLPEQFAKVAPRHHAVAHYFNFSDPLFPGLLLLWIMFLI